MSLHVSKADFNGIERSRNLLMYVYMRNAN